MFTLTLITVLNIKKIFVKNFTLIQNAPLKQLRSFLHEHFKILKKDLHSTYHRKVFEGLYITLNKPTINQQHEHKNMKF
jgi:hypothetical protein